MIGLTAIAAPAQAAGARLGHGANAYGSSIEVSSIFTSGPSALATLGCTTHAGVLHVNSAAAVALLTAGSLGAVNDSVSTTGHGTGAESQVSTVSLFSALITANTVTATADVSKEESGFVTTGDTTAANLSINGSPITLPAPNTVIPLADFGSVTVNEQISKITDTTATMITNALHINITGTNAFNFPVGTDIVIGHAKASLNTAPTRILDGKAYGTQLFGTGVLSGKTALVHLACQGTDGKVKSNITAGTVIPGVVNTGTEKSTATGVASRGFASGTTTSTIQNVTLLNLVSVDVVKAQANVTAIGKDRTFTDTGSSFGGISVLGIPTLPDPVPPNSMYEIPGLGTLYLHRVIQTEHHIEVRMIELIISVDTGTLPVGTDIRIGVAEASVHG